MQPPVPFLSLRMAAGRFIERHVLKRVDPRDRLMGWDFDSEGDLFNALVGRDFGANPETKKEEIRQSKRGEAMNVVKALGLGIADDVLDIGSGVGYVAAHIAVRVKSLRCVDISPSFLRSCREETSRLPNVRCHLIRPGSLKPIATASIDKAYATGVFIHLNLFEITMYLQELKRVLRPGGSALITIADSDVLDVSKDTQFQAMLEVYRMERLTLFNLMNWNSARAVCGLARQVGFSDAKVGVHSGSSCEILLQL